MNSKNRSVILVIAFVLIVCVVALVAVLYFTWQLISQPVEAVFNIFRSEVEVVTTDYNFDVNEASDKEVKEEAPQVVEPDENGDQIYALNVNLTDQVYNYNFRVPAKAPIDPNLFNIKDAILNDAKLATAGLDPKNFSNQSKLGIQIPKIGVNSPAWQGVGASQLLEKGFWIYPASTSPGEGEIIMLCHRRYFGPNDPRTCWYLDKVGRGDSIYMQFQGVSFEYKVSNIQVFPANDPRIYQYSRTKDAIRIVTCTPLYSDTHRLVVFAERV